MMQTYANQLVVLQAAVAQQMCRDFDDVDSPQVLHDKIKAGAQSQKLEMLEAARGRGGCLAKVGGVGPWGGVLAKGVGWDFAKGERGALARGAGLGLH